MLGFSAIDGGLSLRAKPESELGTNAKSTDVRPKPLRSNIVRYAIEGGSQLAERTGRIFG